MSTVFEKKFSATIEAQQTTESGVASYQALIDEVAEGAVLNEEHVFSAQTPEDDSGSGETNGHASHLTEEPPRHSRLSSFMPAAMIHGRPWKWMLLTFGMGLLAGAGVVFVVMSARVPREVVKEKVVYKDKLVYRDAPLAAAQSTSENDVGGDVIMVGDDAKTVSKRKGRRSRQAPETQEERKQRLLAELSPSSRTTDAGSSGQGLTQQQMSAVVNKNRSSLQLCYERELKKGTAPSSGDLKVVFSVNVGTSGTVTKVSMRGDGTQVAGLKKCLDGAVKSWLFPAGGAASTVQFPIIFTPSR
ncbi:MAG: AgmX/PglI C-terminal domain-containing protein [Deltaproteobacteria bacterium]|nr:AgmX/PglI C-terminal domain-containing protein [Deltaproteobacteria bacterium]MBN2670556.1 AgmX/PglI C-terminal domain-containing protein [Deltaproteobacteria bacterium]